MYKIPIEYKAKNNVYEEFLITQQNDYAIMLSEDRSKSQICNFSYIKGCPKIKSKYVKCIISDVIFWQWIMGDTFLTVKICTFQIFILCIHIAFIIMNKKKKCFPYLFLGSQTIPTRQAEDTLSQRFPVSCEANNELMFSYMRPSKRQNYDTYLFFPMCGGSEEK